MREGERALDVIIEDTCVLAPTTRPAPDYHLAPGGVPHDENPTAGFLERHSIGIHGADIVWIRPAKDVTAAERSAAETVIDGRGLVAIPGLINTHTHSAMTMFRNAAEDVSTSAWFNDYIWPMEVNLTARDVRLGARLAVAEMFLAGVTTFADHYFHMDEIARVVEETGARALLADTYFSSQGQEGIERSAAFAEHWNGAADGRITTALGPHAPYTVGDDDLRRTAELSSALGVRTHIHAAENIRQTRSSRALRSASPIQVLHDTGIIEAGVLIAHGAGIEPDDLRWLTPYADRVGVACCDKVYMKHAQSGVTPVRMLHNAGVSVGVGTDGAAGHNTLDVLESMRLLALNEKDREADGTWLTSAHALDLVTRQSAEVVGLAGVVGVLAAGRRADIALIDIRGAHMQPVHDLRAALVYSVMASDVRTVLVDGAIVVRDRKLLTIDVQETIDELNVRAPQLRDRSHGLRIQDYDS